MPTAPRPPKPFLPIADQIARLQGRGMAIEDLADARHRLESVGYYRLSGYWFPFRQRDGADPSQVLDQFVAATTFAEVAALYEFDRRLRAHLQVALERVEVAMRSQIGHRLGALDPLAHQDPQWFRPSFRHSAWLSTANRRITRATGRDQFVDHHIANYGGQLPIWVLTDILDFADISILFEGMRSADQQALTAWFQITPPPPRPGQSKSSHTRELRRLRQSPALANWLLQLSMVRNICAHHGRIWNRQLPPVGTTRLRGMPEFTGLPEQSERLFGAICILGFLLKTAAPASTWRAQTKELLADGLAALPSRSHLEVGLPPGWEALPIWAA